MTTYFLRGSRGGQGVGSVRPENFPTLGTLLERAAVLYDEPGPRVLLEIALSKDGPVIRDFHQKDEWNRNGRLHPPESANPATP